MQEPHEQGPAPQPTSSLVLWLMAAVVVGGSGLLVVAQATQPVDLLASAAGRAPRQVAAPAVPRPASSTPAGVSPALGKLAVP